MILHSPQGRGVAAPIVHAYSSLNLPIIYLQETGPKSTAIVSDICVNHHSCVEFSLILTREFILFTYRRLTNEARKARSKPHPQHRSTSNLAKSSSISSYHAIVIGKGPIQMLLDLDLA